MAVSQEAAGVEAGLLVRGAATRRVSEQPAASITAQTHREAIQTRRGFNQAPPAKTAISGQPSAIRKGQVSFSDYRTATRQAPSVLPLFIVAVIGGQNQSG